VCQNAGPILALDEFKCALKAIKNQKLVPDPFAPLMNSNARLRQLKIKN
jgi:hypothetical protein